MIVSEALHARFVEVSGDRNPMHVDELVARRLPFGERVVHGVHLVLLALDSAGPRVSVRRVRATFRHPVPVGGEVRFDTSTDGDRIDIVVRHDAWVAADVSIWPNGHHAAIDRAAAVDPWPFDAAPVVRSGADIAIGATGSVPMVGGDGDPMRAALSSLTRLVGMEMPGLHSLFSSFDVSARDVTIQDDGGIGVGETIRDGELRYRVASYDDRFGMVKLRVESATCTGTVTAFVRPAPTDQPGADTWTERPTPDDFAGQRALVVGGSRGLGQIIASLLVAGGARVTRTSRYETGQDTVTCDVRSPADLARLAAACPDTTHLYYCASPAIFRGVHGVYSDVLFDEFRVVYVDAFRALVDQLGRLDAIFVPSSTAVTEAVPGLAEYADAKRLAEQTARSIAAERDVRMAIPRLPRLATDQTASFLPTETADIVTTVLPELRALAEPAPTDDDS